MGGGARVLTSPRGPLPSCAGFHTSSPPMVQVCPAGPRPCLRHRAGKQPTNSFSRRILCLSAGLLGYITACAMQPRPEPATASPVSRVVGLSSGHPSMSHRALCIWLGRREAPSAEKVSLAPGLVSSPSTVPCSPHELGKRGGVSPPD